MEKTKDIYKNKKRAKQIKKSCVRVEEKIHKNTCRK